MHTYSICFQLFPFKRRLIANKTASFKVLQLRFACPVTILASEKPNIVMQSNQLTTLKYMLRVDCAAAIIYDGLFNDDEDIVHIPFEEDIFLETHVFWQAGRYVSSSLKSFMSYISKVDFGSDTGLTVIQRECHA